MILNYLIFLVNSNIKKNAIFFLYDNLVTKKSRSINSNLHTNEKIVSIKIILHYLQSPSRFAMEIKNKMFFYTLFLRVKCIFTVCFHYPNVRSFSQSKKKQKMMFVLFL